MDISFRFMGVFGIGAVMLIPFYSSAAKTQFKEM